MGGTTPPLPQYPVMASCSVNKSTGTSPLPYIECLLIRIIFNHYSNSSKPSPSSEANSQLLNEFPVFYENPMVHYRVHNSPPILRPCVTFRNKPFFLRWGDVSPSPNPQVRGPHLIGYPRLPIQYIRSYILKKERKIFWSPERWCPTTTLHGVRTQKTWNWINCQVSLIRTDPFLVYP